jgi:hypothetical protein
MPQSWDSGLVRAAEENNPARRIQGNHDVGGDVRWRAGASLAMMGANTSPSIQAVKSQGGLFDVPPLRPTPPIA